MGKILVIKGSNFSANAVKKVDITNSQTFNSPFNTNDIKNVSSKLSDVSSQYWFAGGGKNAGFILPVVLSDETTIVVNTTDAYPGKTINGVTNVVCALYFASIDLTDVDITQIPKSASLVDLTHITESYCKADNSTTFTVPNNAKGAILYMWVNDNVDPVTTEIFNEVISSIVCNYD